MTLKPRPEYTDEDMANVGRALMERLPDGYSYLDCPTEIVTDLQNDLSDYQAFAEPALLAAHKWFCEATAPNGAGDNFLNEGEGWKKVETILDLLNAAIAQG